MSISSDLTSKVILAKREKERAGLEVIINGLSVRLEDAYSSSLCLFILIFEQLNDRITEFSKFIC